MAVSFQGLQIGRPYERPVLAQKWGYESFHAISRGVVTPTGTPYIILFVTKVKQEALTQYRDRLDGDTLHWEGEKGHRSDERIVNAAATGDEIHLFYREVHHSPFIYLGQVSLTDVRTNRTQPSQFVFNVGQAPVIDDPIADIEAHKEEFSNLRRTEKLAIVKSRIGQGQFRTDLMERWRGCAVTGLVDPLLLRASHIKPWRKCTNVERLDPDNGVLLQPMLDHLFDAGLVTFDDTGNLILSSLLSSEAVRLLGVKATWRLRDTNPRLRAYLAYHRSNVFKT